VVARHSRELAEDGVVLDAGTALVGFERKSE
jgi:hypothetical protein